MVEMLKGIAASDGVAVAKAYLLVQPDLSFTKVTIEDVSAEAAHNASSNQHTGYCAKCPYPEPVEAPQKFRYTRQSAW